MTHERAINALNTVRNNEVLEIKKLTFINNEWRRSRKREGKTEEKIGR